MTLYVRLYAGQTYVQETVCLSCVLEREIYTPYTSLTAEFLASDTDYGNVNRVELVWNGRTIFAGLADTVTVSRRSGVRRMRVQSKTFTSLLAQNELAPGLHANLTVQTLVQGFYQFPYVTVEQDSTTGYIYVKDGTSLWDSLCKFVYKLRGTMPYTVNNHIYLSVPQNTVLHTLTPSLVTETGTVRDTSRLVSHYHMEDLDGNPDAYSQSDADAVAANIVRHKQIPFDRQFLYRVTDALDYRLKFAKRGWHAVYAEYAGFANEELGDRVSLANVMSEATVCRVRMTFSERGMRTKVWAYSDAYTNSRSIY